MHAFLTLFVHFWLFIFKVANKSNSRLVMKRATLVGIKKHAIMLKYYCSVQEKITSRYFKIM